MSRNMTVTSLSFVPEDAATVADTVVQALAWIDLAAHDQSDLIVLPEAFAAGNEACAKSSAGFCTSAEPMDGPTLTAIAQRAARHRCYIAAPVIIEREQGRSNSIVLLDRGGEVCAVYDKVYPPITELEQGLDILPGAGPVVVETEFGKIGLLICFDLNFEELRERYRELDVDLLVFCSMFPGGMLVRMWAMLNGCYVISAFPGSDSVVVNPMGRTLAVSSTPNSRVLTTRLNLDFEVLHLDYNQRKIDELRRRFGAVVELEIHEAEGRMLLTSLDPEISARDICQELSLESIESFFTRSRNARERAIQSGPIHPSTPSSL